jgi:hypothetical protein
MTERRSIGEALATLPPDARGFIQGNAKPARSTRRSGLEVEVVPEVEQADDRREPDRRPTRRTRVRTSATPRARVEVPGSWKVPITTKLHYATIQALRRAYLEQKLNHAMPDTQQEIVEFAVQEWLKKHGFLCELPVND